MLLNWIRNKRNKLRISFVDSEFVDYLYDLFNKNDVWSTVDITEYNCQLTGNKLSHIPQHFQSQIYKKKEHIHWLHILKYPPEGKLDWHNHKRFEKISYVLYMDDVGGTFFKIKDKEVFVKSKRGKIVVFPSEYEHKAETEGKERYVAAGGIYVAKRPAFHMSHITDPIDISRNTHNNS